MYFSNWTTVISLITATFGFVDLLNENNRFGGENITRGLLVLSLCSELIKDTVFWTLLHTFDNIRELDWWMISLSHFFALPGLIYWFFNEESFQVQLKDSLIVFYESLLYLIPVLVHSFVFD